MPFLWLADTDSRIEIQEALNISELVASQHDKGVGGASFVGCGMAERWVHSEIFLRFHLFT